MANCIKLPAEKTDGNIWNMSHFPARFQFVIFRNWNRITVEKLAEVLGTTPAQVILEAERLGLRKYSAESCRIWRERGYLTIIRENWLILNYAQLMNLLEVSEEKLYRILMEEDFMFHKMGDGKPDCPEVKWYELNACELAKTYAIKKLIESYTGNNAGEKEFDFWKKWENDPVPAAAGIVSGDNLRMIYSYCAPFGDVLMPGAVDPFPAGLLARYQKSNINALWLTVLLSDLIPWTGDEDYSENYLLRQATLRKFVEKLAKYGLKLILYLNEPRALPEAIAQRHPDWCGPENANNSKTRAICVSNPAVAEALRKGVADLCKAVPGLGGFLTITMSENLTHCLSRATIGECERCKEHSDPAKNVVTVLSAIRNGMRDAGSEGRLIAWNWAWQSPWDLKILDDLPQDIELMCVSETNLETDCCGIKGRIADYSISHPGPGPVAPRMWQYARKQNRKVIAKVQLNATWELSSLPYIPVPHLTRKHLVNLQNEGISDYMLSWTLGGAPGGNLPLTDCSVEEWCRNISPVYAGEIEKACKFIADGFAGFPFHSTSLIYCGPQNFGCANLLYPQESHRRATMVGFCFDDLFVWSSGNHYPVEVLDKTFNKIASEWNTGLKMLHDLLEKDPGNTALTELYNMAEAGYCIMQSSANQIRFYHYRNKGESWEKLQEIAGFEAELAIRMLQVQKADSRIGFEASNHYMYGENELLEKYIQCKSLMSN